MTDFNVLIGKTLSSVVISDNKEEIYFSCTDGTAYRQYHRQHCCESVDVYDVCGDMADIVGSPVLVADVATDMEGDPAGYEVESYRYSHTWTFYKIDTAKGGVTIRWYGSSNGCYSESVDFEEIAR